MARREYDERTKAEALAALLVSQNVQAVSDEYDIPVGTLKSWKTRHFQEVMGEATLGPLFIEYMEKALKTLIAQLSVMGDEEWLHKQTASELAVLHGVGVDKVMKMVEALNRAQSDD
jgi:transposase-like protein